MNFSFPYYWAVSNLPETAKQLETDDRVDLSIPIRPCSLQVPISEEHTVERSFPGGTVYCLFQWLHEFYQESVQAIDIAYLIPRTEDAEQERLLQFLEYKKSGRTINRLDLLGPSDPQFLGIRDGVVLVGN